MHSDGYKLIWFKIFLVIDPTELHSDSNLRDLDLNLRACGARRQKLLSTYLTKLPISWDVKWYTVVTFFYLLELILILSALFDIQWRKPFWGDFVKTIKHPSLSRHLSNV